jgi:hypothetical protein
LWFDFTVSLSFTQRILLDTSTIMTDNLTEEIES